MSKFLSKYLLTLLLVEFSMLAGHLCGNDWFIGFLFFTILYSVGVTLILLFRRNKWQTE